MENLNKKLEDQNKQVQDLIEKEKLSQEELSKQINEEMTKLIQNIKKLESINPQKINNPVLFGLSQKISEFNIKIAQNTEKIRKNKEEIPEILRKKKESEDFFNKFMGEKKVWLDRLSEKKLQKIAFENGFKYFYEAKTERCDVADCLPSCILSYLLHNTIPMQKNELGLVLCSGFSTTNMKMFMSGKINPYEIAASIE